MKQARMDRFGANLTSLRVQSVKSASIGVTDRRNARLAETFGEDLELAKRHAAAIKDYALANLGALLEQFEKVAVANGIQVHWAATAGSARETVLQLIRARPDLGGPIVKAKSMLSEEIGLNEFLENAGLDVVETDLGEFIVQLDGDKPSHIVAPIIHKNRLDVAQTFARAGLGQYTEDPAHLTKQARTRLRSLFSQAGIGITGVNFGIAESGRIVTVENEGNNRLCATAPKMHIALMGIEKLIPREADLPLLLRLLAGSATGQPITTYTNITAGPSGDGPQELHLVLVDNGRSAIQAGPFRDILRCIRCGACLTVCPVYRQASGHAYRHVYSGPLGAVLAPLLDETGYGDLPVASTLCGACEDVCPVKIPLAHMIADQRARTSKRTLPKQLLSAMLSEDAWTAGTALRKLGSRMLSHVPGWSNYRDTPKPDETTFREWWNGRS